MSLNSQFKGAKKCIIKSLFFVQKATLFADAVGGARQCNFQASEWPWPIRFYNILWLFVRILRVDEWHIYIERKALKFPYAPRFSTFNKSNSPGWDANIVFEVWEPCQSSAFLSVHLFQGCHTCMCGKRPILKANCYITCHNGCSGIGCVICHCILALSYVMTLDCVLAVCRATPKLSIMVLTSFTFISGTPFLLLLLLPLQCSPHCSFINHKVEPRFAEAKAKVAKKEDGWRY